MNMPPKLNLRNPVFFQPLTISAPIIAAVAVSIVFSTLAVAQTVAEKQPAENPTANQEQETEKAAAAAAESSSEQAAEDGWIQLFNGKDLTGWTPKIRGYELGDNYADTFRVVDGLLTVSYDKYVDADFMSMDNPKKKGWDKFGHLFYKDSFSNYDLRVEYRFTGDQVPNGPGWAFRNNGLMLHGQDPALMTVNQKFPVSIEVQLLGGDGTNPRTNLNLCTPGTNVVMNDELFKKHCTSSNSPTFHGDQWVTVVVEVRGSKVIRHKVDDVVVLEYMQPQFDERDAEAKPLIKDGNLLIEGGTISLQSESHPTQFRKIELKEVEAE